jgi:hypothetical protein
MRRESTNLAMLAALCSFLLPGPGQAHHGNSTFDTSKTITVEGVVTKWQFINPHSGIWVAVTDASGQTVEWSGEFVSVQDLYRTFSWNKDTFKAGDRITMSGNPDRRGRNALWTTKIVMPDGSEVVVRGEE